MKKISAAWARIWQRRAGADTSAIGISGVADFSEGLLEMLADLARNASFPEEEFERERRQRMEGLKIQRTTPDFLATERLRRTLFGEHPYAIVAPPEAQVAAFRREQLEEFYRQNYSPANALLILVGDFSAAAILDQVEKIFGAWKAPAPAPQKWPEPPRQSGRQVHLVHLPGSVQTQVLIGNLAITRRDPDWYRMVLANSIYGGAFHSRLVMNIREQKGYTYSPRSGISALREYGYFTVHAAVRNEVTAATLTEMFYEMDRMRSLPVTDQELESARSYLTGVFSLGVATQDGVLSPTFHRLSRPLARRLSRNLSRANQGAHCRRYSRRRSPPFRFRQRANRPGRRPRPNRRPSRPLRPGHGVRSAGESCLTENRARFPERRGGRPNEF